MRRRALTIKCSSQISQFRVVMFKNQNIGWFYILMCYLRGVKLPQCRRCLMGTVTLSDLTATWILV